MIKMWKQLFRYENFSFWMYLYPCGGQLLWFGIYLKKKKQTSQPPPTNQTKQQSNPHPKPERCENYSHFQVLEILVKRLD